MCGGAQATEYTFLVITKLLPVQVELVQWLRFFWSGYDLPIARVDVTDNANPMYLFTP